MDNKIQKVAVAGFLEANGKVLIVRRSKKEKFLPGVYELPGGKVDFGEEVELALVREFKEETNLNINVVAPFRVFSYITKERTIHTISIVCIVSSVGVKEDLKLSPSHDDYKWIEKKDVESFPLTDEIKTNIVQGFNLIETWSK